VKKTVKKKESAKALPPDPRIWCESCHIRIAPTEERIERGEHRYHLRCRPKPHRPTDRYLLHG
jgi:hypothetical protein